jgi:hypothetical protein
MLVFLLLRMGMSGRVLLEVGLGVGLAARMIRPSDGRTERGKPC